ncbi:response regulator [Flavobacterium qiangtangense]|uniref:Response regulator n=1 Tax=Flavobacterium qiangtangense TaxID=1442595 RepID=A0ABW1PTV2_9FLAO
MKLQNDRKINIAILDDHKMVAGLLRENMKQFEFVETVNLFFTATDFFDFLTTNKIDLLIVDVFMPEMNGVDIVKKCRELHKSSQMKIIMLSSSIEYKVINDAISFGANAYVTKEDLPDEVSSAIKYVFGDNSRPYFSNNAREVLLNDRFEEDNLVKLSPREDQLLKLICDAKTAKEIASELDLSINTIHFYTKRLMVKMNVNRTPDLILKAINKGFVLNLNRNMSSNISAM